jgi:photosystem II stability/assembly factor-like uncharacterized protein
LKRILSFIIILADILLAQWQPVIPSPTLNGIVSLNAFSDSHYIISTLFYTKPGVEIFSTSDAGTHWKSLHKNENIRFYDAFFLNEFFGYAISNYPYKKFWKTSDGGISWSDYNLSAYNSYEDVVFLNESIGFISGLDHILKSTDGGLSWAEMYRDIDIGGFMDLQVLNENFIAAAGGPIRISTDGGINWSVYRDTTIEWGFSGIYFLDTLNGFASNNKAIVFKTSDGGESWSRIINWDNSYYSYTTTSFMNKTGVIAFAAYEYGGSTLFITTNGGETWFDRGVRLVSTISFINDSTFLVAGSDGYIAKTSDYGLTFTTLTELVGGFRGMAFPEKGIGYFLSDYNYLLHTTDNGNSFNRIPGTPYANNSGMSMSNDSTIYVSGNVPAKIFRSTNRGLDWDTTILPNASFTYEMSFPTEQTGYVTTWAGVYKTSDAGENWFRISNIGRASLFFVDEMTGFLGKGDILKTTDGGINWYNKGYYNAESVFMFNESIGAAGKYGIHYTYDGGETWEMANIVGSTSSLRSLIIFKHDEKLIAYASFTDRKLFYSLDTCKSWREDEYYIQGIVNYWSYTARTLWAATGNGFLVKRENFEDLLTSVDEDNGKIHPSDYNLFQNYPNPFNPLTTISYSIPQSAQVNLKIFDILGNEIAELINEEKQPGEYQVQWNAESFSSGVYFYQLKAGSFISTKKLLLMK